MIVNAIMTIYGRPTYTHVALASLSKSDVVTDHDFRLGAIIVDHPRFKFNVAKEMVAKYPFAKLPIIQQRYGINDGSYCSRQCFMLGSLCFHENEGEWFVYIENDVLFNPDWFKRMVEIYEEASLKYKVGILTPVKNLNRGTVHIDCGDTWVVKNKAEAQCWLMKPDVLMKTLDYPLSVWAPRPVGFDQRILGALHADGYMNISSNNSHVAHIGYMGIKDNPVSHKSRGFMPHERIKGLYDFAESLKDGWTNKVEFPEYA